jgi:hypothetical protein
MLKKLNEYSGAINALIAILGSIAAILFFMMSANQAKAELEVLKLSSKLDNMCVSTQDSLDILQEGVDTLKVDVREISRKVHQIDIDLAIVKSEGR